MSSLPDEENSPLEPNENEARAQNGNEVEKRALSDAEENLDSCKHSFDNSYQKICYMKGALLRAKQERKVLEERNNILEKQLEKAKREDEYLYETRNVLEELSTRLAAVKERVKQRCKEKEDAGGPLQHSRKRMYDVEICGKCPICMKAWTKSGEHNVCSLPCGHFFGRSCITELFQKYNDQGSSKCPICSTKATIRRVRDHNIREETIGQVGLKS